MPRGKVKRVIDGDTFEIRSGERIRIAGLNAPELTRKGGSTAKRRLQNELRVGKSVGLSMPLAKSYGRTIRRVTVRGKNINKLVAKPTRRSKRK
jgi:micrococcal nuclease